MNDDTTIVITPHQAHLLLRAVAILENENISFGTRNDWRDLAAVTDSLQAQLNE